MLFSQVCVWFLSDTRSGLRLGCYPHSTSSRIISFFIAPSLQGLAAVCLLCFSDLCVTQTARGTFYLMSGVFPYGFLLAFWLICFFPFSVCRFPFSFCPFPCFLSPFSFLLSPFSFLLSPFSFSPLPMWSNGIPLCKNVTARAENWRLVVRMDITVQLHSPRVWLFEFLGKSVAVQVVARLAFPLPCSDWPASRRHQPPQPRYVLSSTSLLC